MERLLDNLEHYIPKIEKLILEKEKSGRKREVSLHRWWSKRFIYLYRTILSSFLLKNDDGLFDAIEKPEILDANGLVYLEPLAGGGTRVVEASLYNFTSYGIDINPLAVRIIRGYSILRGNVNFNQIISIIEEVKSELSALWTYKGQDVSYFLITRGKVPSWIMTNKKRKVILCPNCGNIFETENSEEVICPYCGDKIKITIKPYYEPRNFVNYSGWKVFGFIVNKKFIFDKDWLIERTKLLANVNHHFEIDVNIDELKEGKRLLRFGITTPELLFTKAQILTFHKLAEKSKNIGENERLLLMLSVTDSVKTCSILSRWYPPLNEPVPFGGGVKGFWIPEYTVETNPLTSHARSTIISGIRNQYRIRKFRLRGEINAIQGDATVIDYPKSDLIVIDPPYYGLALSYTSLSFPHAVVANQFERISLRESLNKEISHIDYFEKILKILMRSKEALKDNGRIVLIINMRSRMNMLDETIEKSKLNVINRYDIIGESPGKLGRSQNRINSLIILRK